MPTASSAMWTRLAISLLLVSVVTVTDARHGCTTCPSNGCPQNEAHIGFCNDARYVSESYQCSDTRSELKSRKIYYKCGWFNWASCPGTRTYYETVTHYHTCHRSRRNCQRRCCSGFQLVPGWRCEPRCTGGCRNGGVCLDPEVCECPSNWQGQYCEIDVNECDSNNGGCSDHCSNTPGSYSCHCREYANLDPDGRHCTCRPGFIQNDATLTCDDIDECANNNGGCEHNCINTPGSHRCQCNPGYELHDLKKCLPICTGGCLNGGTCVLAEKCDCSKGWSGQKCESDIDECADNTGGCKHRCINTPGSHRCQCNPGYELRGLKICLPICTGGCLNGGECVLPETCNCSTGWEGQNCKSDIDECADNNGGCDHNCTNMPGSHICQCDPGFELHKESSMCLAICTGGCLNGGECILPETCSCSTGWTGANCERDIDECTKGISGCHQNCTNTVPGYVCSCDAGYTLNEDGHTCNDINECNSPDNGGCDQICSNTPGGYNCSCKWGFTMGENNTCEGSGVPGVPAAIVAVPVTVSILVLCVVVAIAMMLRGPVCQKAAKDKTRDTKVTPNPAYGIATSVKSNLFLNGEEQLATDDDGNEDDDVDDDDDVEKNLLKKTQCRKAVKDMIQDTEPTTEEDSGFTLPPSRAYDATIFVNCQSNKLQDEEAQPAIPEDSDADDDNDDDDVEKSLLAKT